MDHVYMQNSTITMQHRILPSTELLAEMLQNVSEGLAPLCCHLLMSYKGEDITLI
jgi:hypothetical protein